MLICKSCELWVSLSRQDVPKGFIIPSSEVAQKILLFWRYHLVFLNFKLKCILYSSWVPIFGFWFYATERQWLDIKFLEIFLFAFSSFSHQPGSNVVWCSKYTRPHTIPSMCEPGNSGHARQLLQPSAFPAVRWDSKYLFCRDITPLLLNWLRA